MCLLLNSSCTCSNKWFSEIKYLQPEKVEFELKLGQSKPLYNAFKDIKESSNWDALSEAQKRIVECEYVVLI